MTKDWNERIEVETNLLAGHQKTWINVDSGRVLRLPQTPPRVDHDKFAVLNAAAMGIDLSGLPPEQMSLILAGKPRSGSTPWTITLAASAAGWVRVHRNTKTREINVDAYDSQMALTAARIAAIGLRDVNYLSLDLEVGLRTEDGQRVRNLQLRGSQVDEFLEKGAFADGAAVYSAENSRDNLTETEISFRR